MDKVTINSLGVKISMQKDNEMVTLNLRFNKKISYLPIEIHEIFPSLIIIEANDCQIKSVTKANLRSLDKIKILWLNNNRIEKISSDAFEDLTSLIELGLSEILLL